MKRTPLFLEPVFQERIWGGTALAEQFNYELSSEVTGECWAISAHPNGQSVVKNGDHAGRELGELWKNNHELFGNHHSAKFPLLTKILDANADLSVQVHPDDEYGSKYENGELGKTECWYIIDCKEGAEMIYGHNASSKEELNEMINRGKWNQLLRRVSIRPGDFFYVPSGTIHALCEGTLVLETQQSSDTTYRVYDYDRVDKDGNKRELHLEKAMDVTNVPHVDEKHEHRIEKIDDAAITTFVESDYFTVQKWCISGKVEFQEPTVFYLVSVLEGEGDLKLENEEYSIKKGDHFILPYKLKKFSISGQVDMIVSFCRG
jgi:mannose-6-phosphate isomerase